jgi:hypothetical protein
MGPRGGSGKAHAHDEALVPELQEYFRQLAAIERETEILLEGLTPSQLMWRENPKTWSVAECFNHLVVTGHHSLHNMRRAIVEARRSGWVSKGPFRHGRDWKLVRSSDGCPAQDEIQGPDGLSARTGSVGVRNQGPIHPPAA